MLRPGGPAGDGTVPRRAGELGHFRPVGVHYVNLLHATALAGEGELLAIRRPSREVIGGRVIGKLGQPSPIGIDRIDVESAGSVAAERYPLTARRPGGKDVAECAIIVRDEGQSGPVGIYGFDVATSVEATEEDDPLAVG